MPLAGADFSENAKPLAQAYALAEVARINLTREVQELKDQLKDEKRLAEWFREIQVITGFKPLYKAKNLEKSYLIIHQAVMLAISGRSVEEAIAQGFWIPQSS